MPIYRCNKCGFVAETVAVAQGSKANCARCSHPSTVYETPFFVEKLAERYFAALREIEALKSADKPTETGPAQVPETPPAQPLLEKLDLHNTAQLATPEQHQPLKEWFEARQINAQFDYSTVDTTGFFDDAARALGNNHAFFAELLDRVRYAYRNSHGGLNLELASLMARKTRKRSTTCAVNFTATPCLPATTTKSPRKSFG
jgi:hypothetical protein